jgi:hypothetical protein
LEAKLEENERLIVNLEDENDNFNDLIHTLMVSQKDDDPTEKLDFEQLCSE